MVGTRGQAEGETQMYGSIGTKFQLKQNELVLEICSTALCLSSTILNYALKNVLRVDLLLSILTTKKGAHKLSFGGDGYYLWVYYLCCDDS